MQKTDTLYTAYVEVLKEELLPAMGCTEPIAIAYAAAAARRILNELPCEVCVTASGNIIKNVKSVFVPNTGGLRGIPAAAAAGIIAGHDELLLEVISKATEAEQAEIKAYMEHTPITVKLSDSPYIFDIDITVKSEHHKRAYCGAPHEYCAYGKRRRNIARYLCRYSGGKHRQRHLRPQFVFSEDDS